MKKLQTNFKYGVFLVGILLLTSSFTKCEPHHKQAFMGCWIDSIEEKTALTEGRIYRPCDFKEFPPSRFRFEMKLYTNGKCSYLFLAPNDAHKMLEGKWTFNEEDRELQLYDANKKLVKQWRVLDVEKDKLILKEF